ncbi:amidohydrolase [Egicoccus halophilus]|uniref:amidohydrolase n=1 Tax=Egicoccus halophilus TaxID=1670830 RepID=UPI0013EEE687|nr:amidohydrolase [Egicoccus halophilus]
MNAATVTGVGRTSVPPRRGTLLVADRIVTLGRARSEARAMVVRGSRVVWVGDDLSQAPPHEHRLDLTGCVIGPAFVDAHAHLTPTGMGLTGLDLATARSGAEVRHAVASYASQHTGRVLWGHGFDPHAYPDALPGPDELAAVSGGAAVFLSRVDGHACLVDRRTLASAPLARAEGVERDAAGEPTGLLRREANSIVRRWSVGAMSAPELQSARSAAVRHAAALGIASVHEMGGPDIMGLDDFDAWVDGEWPIEIVPYWGSLDVEVSVSRELHHVGGDLFLDGSLGSHTAALCAPYADRPETAGHLELDDDTLADFFEEATRAGLQAGVHAIGDAALHQVVRCWRKVAQRTDASDLDAIRRLRHRLEHAEVIPPELLDDVAELGLIVSAQPMFEQRWGGPAGMYRARLGEERAAWSNPYRALADRGVDLAFGSDSNVTPMDPWGTVRAAEHRHRPQHAVTRLEAVSMSTLGGRLAARQERWVGVVRAGMRADLAVFAGDPYRADDPRDTACVLTLVQGRVAHGDAPLPDAPNR